MRWASVGASRAAVTGSSRASSACSAGQPSRAARASSAARTTGSACGSIDRPSVSALKYSIVPPATIGTRPRRTDGVDRRTGIGDETRRRIGVRGVDDVDQVMRMRARVAASGLAVPMSMPR